MYLHSACTSTCVCTCVFTCNVLWKQFSQRSACHMEALRTQVQFPATIEIASQVRGASYNPRAGERESGGPGSSLPPPFSPFQGPSERSCLQNQVVGTGDMAHSSKALFALTEAQNLGPRPHMVVYNLLHLQFQEKQNSCVLNKSRQCLRNGT